MRMTEEEFARLMAQRRGAGARAHPQAPSRLVYAPTATQDVAEVILRDTPGLEPTRAAYKSTTEARYAEQLAWRVACGEVRRWWFEPIRLFLAPKTTLTPDFLIQWADETKPLTFHEVKGGFAREDSLVKLKVAARLYTIFCFILVQWNTKRQAWTWKEIPCQ